LDAAQLPGFARYEKLRELDEEFRSFQLREWRQYDMILVRLLLPAVVKVAEAEQRVDTMLHCTVAGIATERFRLKNGRWPVDLDEVVKAGFLDKIPEDLFDGNPIRFRKSPDGVVIYSVGKNGDYAGNALDGAMEYDEDATRWEFRLWDPASRRQPPLEPKKLDLDPDPEP
jgi:hypothetical protein